MIAVYDPFDAAWHFLKWWWLLGGAVVLVALVVAIVVFGRDW